MATHKNRGHRTSGESTRSSRPDSPEVEVINDPDSVARLICLRLLEQRPRTRSELTAALSRRGVPDGAAERVLDRFAEVGLVDDLAFAATFVSGQHVRRKLSGRAIGLQLRKRGVSEETVAQAVAEIDPASEESAARELVASKLARYRDSDPQIARRRLTAMLGRRGYSTSLSLMVVREALGEQSDELDSIRDDEVG